MGLPRAEQPGLDASGYSNALNFPSQTPPVPATILSARQLSARDMPSSHGHEQRGMMEARVLESGTYESRLGEPRYADTKPPEPRLADKHTWSRDYRAPDRQAGMDMRVSEARLVEPHPSEPRHLETRQLDGRLGEHQGRPAFSFNTMGYSSVDVVHGATGPFTAREPSRHGASLLTVPPLTGVEQRTAASVASSFVVPPSTTVPPSEGSRLAFSPTAQATPSDRFFGNWSSVPDTPRAQSPRPRTARAEVYGETAATLASLRESMPLLRRSGSVPATSSSRLARREREVNMSNALLLSTPGVMQAWPLPPLPPVPQELTVRLEMLESHTTNARIEAILEKGVVHLKGDVPSAAQIRAVEERKDHEWKERLQAVESSRDAHQIKAENLQRRYDDLKAEKERLVVERDRLQFEGERRHNGYDGEAEDWRRKGRVLEEQADALRAQVQQLESTHNQHLSVHQITLDEKTRLHNEVLRLQRALDEELANRTQVSDKHGLSETTLIQTQRELQLLRVKYEELQKDFEESKHQRHVVGNASQDDANRQLRKELQSLQVQHDELRMERDSVQYRHGLIESEVAGLRADAERLHSSLLAEQDGHAEALRKCRMLEGKLEDLRTEKQSMQSQNGNDRSEAERLRAEVMQYEARSQEMIREREQLKMEVSRHLSQSQSEAQQFEARMQTLRLEKRELEERSNRLSSDVAQLEAHVRDLTVQNTELTRRGSQTDQRSAQDQRLIEETEEALSLLRNEKLQWETQMESKSRQFAQLESRIKTLTTENAQLMEFKSGHRSEARHREELEGRITRLTRENAEMRSASEQRDKSLRDLREELSEVKREKAEQEVLIARLNLQKDINHSKEISLDLQRAENRLSTVATHQPPTTIRTTTTERMSYVPQSHKITVDLDLDSSDEPPARVKGNRRTIHSSNVEVDMNEKFGGYDTTHLRQPRQEMPSLTSPPRSPRYRKAGSRTNEASDFK